MTKVEELCKNNNLRVKVFNPDVNLLSNDWSVLVHHIKTDKCFKFMRALEPKEEDILRCINTFLKMSLKIGDTVILSDGFKNVIQNEDDLADIKYNSNYIIERVY